MTIPTKPTLVGLDRNLALDLVRATEASALAASRFLGQGDENAVDQAAVDAVRPVLGTIAMRVTVVIGEGEKDEAPMLYNGEIVGDGTGPEVDLAVDPVDGTTLTAKSLLNALAILDRPRHEEDLVKRVARPAPGSSSCSTVTSPKRSWRPSPTPASTS